MSVTNLFASLPPFLLFVPRLFLGGIFLCRENNSFQYCIVIWWPVVALAVLQITLLSFYDLHVVSGGDSVSKTGRRKQLFFFLVWSFIAPLKLAHPVI